MQQQLPVGSPEGATLGEERREAKETLGPANQGTSSQPLKGAGLLGGLNTSHQRGSGGSNEMLQETPVGAP